MDKRRKRKKKFFFHLCRRKVNTERKSEGEKKENKVTIISFRINFLSCPKKSVVQNKQKNPEGRKKEKVHNLL